MSIQTFRYIQQLAEEFYDSMLSDKKNWILWSRRLHLVLLAYKELLLTICAMDKSPDDTVRESSRVIKSNIFYILEYRELIITLLNNYDELKMSNAYLKDLMETQHVFIKLLEGFCGADGNVVVQKKAQKKRKKKKATQDAVALQPDVNLDSRWDQVAPQLSAVLEGNTEFPSDVVPFDAASDVPIDEQKSEAMINVQRKLRDGEFENAIGLLRAAREVWPENNCFGSNNMAPEEEFLALRDIFIADLGENDVSPPVQEQPIYDENDEVEDDDEEDPEHVSETNFKFQDFIGRLAHPKVIRACGLALRDFQNNSANTNNCIVKLLHRIAFDCKMYVMVFQVSIFQTFQKIFANKHFPQYRELVRFATYIVRQFIKVTEVNKKVYMESLFWTNRGDAYCIEHGYDKLEAKVPSRAWSEEEEEELRQLFMEHQQNQLEEDIVDWIVNNLVDNTRTRRGVLKKLKEMYLLVDYKGARKSGARHPRQWNEEEETQLRELYQEFRDAADPVGCIIGRLEATRSRPKVVQKLLDLGLIQDKSEVRKKRSRSAPGASSATRQTQESDSEVESNVSDDEDDDLNEAENSAPVQRTATKNKSRVKKKTKPKNKANVASDSLIANLLIKLVNLEMTEALEWLKESFEDAVEDFESNDCCEGIPLVPIMDYAVNAMENADFQETLKALGIVPPSDEQETYWRIPGDLTVEIIRKNITTLQQAIDKNLTIPENESSNQRSADIPINEILDDDSSESFPEANGSPAREEKKTTKKSLLILESDDEDTASVSQESEQNNAFKKKSRRIVQSDDEDSTPSASQTTTFRKLIDSDDDDEGESSGSMIKNRNVLRKIIDSEDEEEESTSITNTNDNNSDKETEENKNGDSKRHADSPSDEEPAPKRNKVEANEEL